MSRFGKSIGQTEHQYVAGRLSAYLDGELPPSERSAVEHHLATCRSCQWDLATLRQSVQWTRELPTIPLPRAFTVPAPAQPRRAARRRWTFLPLLQGATALVALLLFFVVAGDVMFTGLLPSFEQQEQAPAAVAATQVVEEALQVEAVVELEAEVAVEKAVAEPPQAPEPASAMPTEALLGDRAGGAPAPPAVEAAQVVTGGAQEEKEGETADETRAAELTPAPAAEVTWPQPSAPTRQLRLTRTLSMSSTPGVTVVITGAVAI
jgi:anti-sigma factor RsiW